MLKKELEKLLKPFNYEVLSIKDYTTGHMRVMLLKVEPPAKKKRAVKVDDQDAED